MPHFGGIRGMTKIIIALGSSVGMHPGAQGTGAAAISGYHMIMIVQVLAAAAFIFHPLPPMLCHCSR